jgi:hypothetical protein
MDWDTPRTTPSEPGYLQAHGNGDGQRGPLDGDAGGGSKRVSQYDRAADAVTYPKRADLRELSIRGHWSRSKCKTWDRTQKPYRDLSSPGSQLFDVINPQLKSQILAIRISEIGPHFAFISSS